MRVTLHLCSPPGEATRRELARLLNLLKEDNRLVIAAMMREGYQVPDTVWEMELRYRPPTPDEAKTPMQEFYCMADMVERGEFSCGDAAALEAAVQTEKYGRDTEVLCVAQGSYEYHAIYVCGDGAVDPTQNWLMMDAASRGQVYLPPGAGADRRVLR